MLEEKVGWIRPKAGADRLSALLGLDPERLEVVKTAACQGRAFGAKM